MGSGQSGERRPPAAPSLPQPPSRRARGLSVRTERAGSLTSLVASPHAPLPRLQTENLVSRDGGGAMPSAPSSVSSTALSTMYRTESLLERSWRSVASSAGVEAPPQFDVAAPKLLTPHMPLTPNPVQLSRKRPKRKTLEEIHLMRTQEAQAQPAEDRPAWRPLQSPGHEVGNLPSFPTPAVGDKFGFDLLGIDMLGSEPGSARGSSVSLSSQCSTPGALNPPSFSNATVTRVVSYGLVAQRRSVRSI